MGAHPAIRPEAFIRYKFLNSLFLGLSVGAVFVLYTPLSPAVFSAGGIGLALGTLIVATQYQRILAPDWFFRLSLGVELVTLSGVVAVLLFPLELALALFIYIGYQVTFSLGNYLVRCETLLMVSVEQLRKLDVAKQAGYLLGMGGAWAVYAGLEHFAAIDDRVEQVVSLHWVLAVVEVAVVVALWRAFNRDQLALSAPLIRDEAGIAAD
jgi:putative membrane protein